MKKHVLWISLVLLAVLLLCLVMTAHAEDGTVHVWDNGAITTPATCSTDGVITYTCTRPGCGATRTETIPATGQHSWDGGSVTTSPGCTTDGIRTYTCTVCGTTRTETIPATGQHSWDGGSVTSAPGCTTDGVRTYTCTVCGTAYTEAVPAEGHKPETLPAVAATCEAPGKTEGRVCTVCGEILEMQQNIPAKGHDWGPWKEGKLPTCTEKGKNYSVCAVCGATRYRDDIEPLGHDWDEGVVTKEAGYLEDGEIVYTCRRDPSHTQTEVIPAKVQDESAVPTLMSHLRNGNLPKIPDTADAEPLKLEKDIEDTELPEDGSGAVLSVEVSGGVPPYSYSWVCTHDIKGENVYEYVGGNEPECPIYMPGVYFCNITDSLEKDIVSSSVVYVYDPLFFWYQPENANLQTGDIMSCGVDGGVPPYHYEWQILGETGAAPVPGAPDECDIYPDQLNIEAGSSVICTVKDKLGHAIESEPGLVYSAEPLEAFCTEPLFLREGEKAEFGVWGKGGVPPYTAVWMDSVGNELPTEEREDGSFYMTTTSYGGYAAYWCILTDSMNRNASCSTSYDYRQLTITKQPQGGTLPRGGGEHLMTVAVADGVEPYRFVMFYPDGNNQVQEGNISECSFTATEPGWYDAYIEDAEGNYAYSDIAIINSYDTLHIAEYTDYEQILEPEGSATLSVTAEGGKEPYSYNWRLVEHGPYDPDLFGTAKLLNAPSIEVFEPGAVYSCTVVDADGDKAYAEQMKVEYAGGIWILKQPEKDVWLAKNPEDVYSLSLECEAISASNNFSYQWYVRDLLKAASIPVTVERGSYGGNIFERTGNSKQVGGRYFCRIRDEATGEEKDTRKAFVSIRVEFEEVTQTNLEGNNVLLKFYFSGGTPPYRVTVSRWVLDGSGTYDVADGWVDSVSPYKFECDAAEYTPKGGKKGITYQIFVSDSMQRSCTALYTCTDPDPGVPAKITFDY